MNTEIITSPERKTPFQPSEQKAHDTVLTIELSDSMFQHRLKQAEDLRPFISLKFYYQIKEKIVKEHSMAKKLLKQEENKQEILDKYSFILNPSYFEQKIIS